MPRKPKPPAPGAAPDIEAMIRVDHAGEYGAVRIYEGQLAVLKRRKGAAASVETIQHMADQEQRHLKTFDRLVNERRVRPTALEPLWRVAGFALGAATAAMGEKAAFACTAAVEEAIDEHYAGQIDALEGKDDRPQIHGEGIPRRRSGPSRYGAATWRRTGAGLSSLSEAIKAGCRIAIKLSERI